MTEDVLIQLRQALLHAQGQASGVPAGPSSSADEGAAAAAVDVKVSSHAPS